MSWRLANALGVVERSDAARYARNYPIRSQLIRALGSDTLSFLDASVSQRTFICRECGALRRAPAQYRNRDGTYPPGPRCHAAAMEVLTNAEATGAAVLRKADRLARFAQGKRVVRRRGGRWRPALTARDSQRADEQVATYQALLRGVR